MPEPRKDETRQKFLDRCMVDLESTRDFPETDQRFAFCNATWTRSAGRGLPRGGS